LGVLQRIRNVWVDSVPKIDWFNLPDFPVSLHEKELKAQAAAFNYSNETRRLLIENSHRRGYRQIAAFLILIFAKYLMFIFHK